jgi:GT2 family glycosyltransferase
MGGVAGHDVPFAGPCDTGPQDESLLLRSVSTVTAACLAVRRDHDLFVGGLNEARFAVACNDLDFRLKLRKAGLRNIVTQLGQ